MEEEQETSLDMGKRPSRQRRHLPTSATLAVSTRSSIDHRNTHVPLLKMVFRRREKPVKKDDTDLKEEGSNSTSYTPTINRTTRNRTKATKNNNNNNNNNNHNEMKKRTTQYIQDEKKLSTKKKVIWIISTLWIMFIMYRIWISLNMQDYENLSIVHFISNFVLKKK